MRMLAYRLAACGIMLAAMPLHAQFPDVPRAAIICLINEERQACITDQGVPFMLPAPDAGMIDSVLERPWNYPHAYDGTSLFFSKQGSLHRWDKGSEKTTILLAAESSAHYGVYYHGALLSPTGEYLATVKGNGVAEFLVLETEEFTPVYGFEELDWGSSHWSSDGRTLTAGTRVLDTDSWRAVNWPGAWLTTTPPVQFVEALLEDGILYRIVRTREITRLEAYDPARGTRPRILFESPNPNVNTTRPAFVFIGATPAGVFFRSDKDLFRCNADGTIDAIASPLGSDRITSTALHYLPEE